MALVAEDEAADRSARPLMFREMHISRFRA